jgi:hypothetical protein
MIFSDDFQIIYNTEFTTEELIMLHSGLSYKIWDKIQEKIHEREEIEFKYGIEV